MPVRTLHRFHLPDEAIERLTTARPGLAGIDLVDAAIAAGLYRRAGTIDVAGLDESLARLRLHGELDDGDVLVDRHDGLAHALLGGGIRGTVHSFPNPFPLTA